MTYDEARHWLLSSRRKALCPYKRESTVTPKAPNQVLCVKLEGGRFYNGIMLLKRDGTIQLWDWPDERDPYRVDEPLDYWFKDFGKINGWVEDLWWLDNSPLNVGSWYKEEHGLR